MFSSAIKRTTSSSTSSGTEKAGTENAANCALLSHQSLRRPLSDFGSTPRGRTQFVAARLGCRSLTGKRVGDGTYGLGGRLRAGG
jgi:hypothetical protein